MSYVYTVFICFKYGTVEKKILKTYNDVNSTKKVLTEIVVALLRKNRKRIFHMIFKCKEKKPNRYRYRTFVEEEVLCAFDRYRSILVFLNVHLGHH
jgi:hypothetical protein